MSRLPAVTGEEMVAALQRAGFRVLRQRGSHIIVAHPDGRRTVVPVHEGEDLGPGIISRILKDAKMSRAEFRTLLSS